MKKALDQNGVKKVNAVLAVVMQWMTGIPRYTYLNNIYLISFFTLTAVHNIPPSLFIYLVVNHMNCQEIYFLNEAYHMLVTAFKQME